MHPAPPDIFLTIQDNIGTIILDGIGSVFTGIGNTFNGIGHTFIGIGVILKTQSKIASNPPPYSVSAVHFNVNYHLIYK
jgi:hypothetical protein